MTLNAQIIPLVPNITTTSEVPVFLSSVLQVTKTMYTVGESLNLARRIC